MKNHLLLKNRDFRLITLSDIISTFGDSLFELVIISYFSSLNNSEFYISVISLFASIPPVLSYFIGILVDKSKNKPLGDIISNVVRSIIFAVISGIFFLEDKRFVVIIYIFLKFISDMFSEYSDSLTFPIISSIFSDDEIEESVVISSISYNISKVSAKAFGGILLILLAHQFYIVSMINSLSFAIAALIGILIYSSLRNKISVKQGNSKVQNNKKSTLIKDLVHSQDRFYSILRFVVLLNFATSPLLSTLYIFINSFSYENKLINIYITIVSIISVIGGIVGNLISGISFLKDRSLEALFKPVIVITLILLFTMFFRFPIYIVLIIFTCYSLILSPLSIKFSSYIIKQQEFNEIGSTIGLLNSIITIGGIVSLFLSMIFINYFSIQISLLSLIGAVLFIYFTNLRKNFS